MEFNTSSYKIFAIILTTSNTGTLDPFNNLIVVYASSDDKP